MWAELLPNDTEDRFNFAGADLRHRGSVCAGQWASPYAAPPGDSDRDGATEAGFPLFVAGAGSSVRTFAIVRLCESASQMAGLLHVRRDGGQGSPLWYGIWRDMDADGVDELLVRRILFGAPGTPKPASATPETIAVLAWDRPGGVLRARQLPGDGSVIVWVPADGEPYKFPADRPLEEVCRELLPVPEGFGAAPTTVPVAPTATGAATQAASRPALP